MDFALLILIAVAIVAVLAYWYGRRRNTAGLAQYNHHRQETKEQSKEKILQFIKSTGKAHNQDIQSLLKTPDSTTTRYLQELEEEGKITQEKNTSQAYYILK